ncbi:MAG: hypothetical protein LJF30_16335 [Acidobacteria bacterium]|nr:hypothetical protein [Acidobacteriota bacterium]
MIGPTSSHYRVVGTFGDGGMGIVYRAEDPRLGRSVALKFLPEGLAGKQQALERFQREARAASALNHSGICTVHEIDEHHRLWFIAWELLEGQTLRGRIGGQPTHCCFQTRLAAEASRRAATSMHESKATSNSAESMSLQGRRPSSGAVGSRPCRTGSRATAGRGRWPSSRPSGGARRPWPGPPSPGRGDSPCGWL